MFKKKRKAKYAKTGSPFCRQQSCGIPSTALKVKRLSVKQRRLQIFSCTIEKEKFSLTVDTNGGIIWMVPELMATNAAFTESTKVNLFDTSLYLPHERGGQQSVPPFVAGGMN